MRPVLFITGLLVALVGATASMQQFPRGYIDPAPVLAAAEKAIGTANLRCVTVSGPRGYFGAVGQQRLADKGVDWPRIDFANYTRTMNWEARTVKEEFDRKPGQNPATWRWGLGWDGGDPTQKNLRQVFMLNGTQAWSYDGPGTAPIPARPADAERWQLDMWLNPHGFLKAARMPGANPRATWRWELGEMGRDGPTASPEKVTVVSIMVMGKYRVDATINKENMLQRIHTRVPDPVIGDMNYEHEFTNASYVDAGNGIKFPTVWHHHEGWDDNYAAQTINGGHNSFDGRLDTVQANVCPDPVAVPEPVRQATFPVRVETQKLADGVYLLGGASHNSVAVEFADYSAVIEAPLNEERSWAVIEEVVKLVPNKPIRYLVNTHQHHDSIGGIRTYMHLGTTIITHTKNFPFYSRDVMNYQPRTVEPDMVALWPPTELAEGYYYENVTENYFLTNGGRTMHMSYVHPLQHVEGMLVAYLPQEKMIIQSDLVNTHEPLPATPTDGMRALWNQVQRLKLDVETIVPIHGKPMKWREFAARMSVATQSN